MKTDEPADRHLHAELAAARQELAEARAEAAGLAAALELAREDAYEQAILVRQAHDSQAWFRRVFEQAPALIAILNGPEHRFVFRNDVYQSVFPGRKLVGKTVREALPDLAGQGIYELLDGAYGTGEPCVGNEVLMRFDHQGNGQLTDVYFNFVYFPTRTPVGEVDGILVHAVDVTEQVRARRVEADRHERIEELVIERTRELAASQAALRGVLDSATSGIFAADAVRDEAGRIVDFRFTLVNPMGEKMLLHPAARLVGNTLCKCFPGTIGGELFATYVAVTESGQPLEVESYYRDDQLDFWLTVSAVKVGDGVAVTFTDISPRKRLEAEAARILEAFQAAQARELAAQAQALESQQGELRLSQSELAQQRRFAETLLERLPAGVAFIDKDFIFRVANPGLASFYGIPREQIINRPVYDVLPGARATVEAIYSRVRDTLEPLVVEAVPVSYLVGQEQKLTYWDARVIPYLDNRGEFEGWLVLAFEVSERVKSQAEFKRQKDLTDRIIESAPVGIAYLNRDMVFESANADYLQMVGFGREAVVGQSLKEVFGAAGQAIAEPLFRQVCETGEPYTSENFAFKYLVHGEERTSHWDFTYQPVRGASGEVEGALLLALEISERVEREQRQREHIQALEEGEKLKDQFLGILSHELRTPINAIMGFGSILDDELIGPLTEEQRKYTGRILGGAETLLALVNDLLDMSRIQAGKFALEPGLVQVQALAAEAIANLDPLAERKRQALTLELLNPPELVPADPQRVMQVLVNLIGNAIKFTPNHGRIAVRVGRRDAALCVEVEDTGIGIGPEDFVLLFRPFTQLDSSNSRNASGTGLGLSIAKALVEAHGGQIGVSSLLGHGSTFWFTLPVEGSGQDI